MLYDFTCRFCQRYIPFKDRHHDQMVQAARSGYQNIAEGSEDSATSKKLEMNLTNVARASLDEVRKDYLKYFSRRNLPVWQDGEPLFTEARNLRPQTLEEAAAWVNQSRPDSRQEERAAKPTPTPPSPADDHSAQTTEDRRGWYETRPRRAPASPREHRSTGYSSRYSRWILRVSCWER